MPPKKKGKKGKKVPAIIDGVDIAQMDEAQLRGFAFNLKNELDREREERNYFQMERDKIRVFWEVTRGQVADLTTELRSKDKDVEVAQEVADIEHKHITQQMKHLQYENIIKVGEMRAEALIQLKLAQENHVQQEQELEKDKRELRRILRERDQTNELQMLQMTIRHNELLTERRFQYENETKDMALMHEQKMQALKAEIELVCRMEMFEVEERKNTQIQKLIESHDQSYNEMKNYYNEITLNNLGLITSLKEQLEALRKQTERSDRLAADTLAENRKLKEPLDAANAELQTLRRKLEHSERDRQQLVRTKQRNAVVEKRLKSLKWETEVLLLRNDTLNKDQEELKDKFDEVFLELQHKTGLENALLQNKIKMLERENEKKDVVVKEMVSACGPTATEKLEGVKKQVDRMLNEKNQEIQELRYEVARVCKAHDDLLASYESKLKEYNVPLEELGFEPLRLTSKWPYLCGPAGLVTKNK